MPIYEYICEECKKTFEKLVGREEEVYCPTCNSSRLNKQYSRFGMGNSSSSQPYDSLPLYNGGGGCGCAPNGCGCKN